MEDHSHGEKNGNAIGQMSSTAVKNVPEQAKGASKIKSTHFYLLETHLNTLKNTV